MSKTICIYHGSCLDGFTSAWVVAQAIPNVVLVEGHYGKEIDLEQLKGNKVIFVDFSTKRDKMIEVAKVATDVLVLDHHESAEKQLVDLPSNVEVVFDMERSGAGITFNYFFNEPELPLIVQLVQDRDLWKFEHPDTKALTAYMFLLDQTIEQWDWLNENLGKCIDFGHILLVKQTKDVADLIDGISREVKFLGHKVWLTNCSWLHASDIGNETVRDNKFSVTWFMQKDGTIKYSLRAKDEFNVAELAETQGGGGHANASGFSNNYPIWTEL